MAVDHVTKTTFQEHVLNTKGVVLVDFYAVWCGPCKLTSPIIDELSTEYAGKAKFVKVDVDEDNELAAQYNVFSIPTFIFFKDGKAVAQMVGAQSKDAFVSELKKVL